MSTNLNIRIDKNLKERAEKAFHSMGLNMSTAIIMFIKQTLIKEEIPFKIEADLGEMTTMELIESDPKYKAELLSRIEEFESGTAEIIDGSEVGW